MLGLLLFVLKTGLATDESGSLPMKQPRLSQPE